MDRGMGGVGFRGGPPPRGLYSAAEGGRLLRAAMSMASSAAWRVNKGHPSWKGATTPALATTCARAVLSSCTLVSRCSRSFALVSSTSSSSSPAMRESMSFSCCCIVCVMPGGGRSILRVSMRLCTDSTSDFNTASMAASGADRTAPADRICLRSAKRLAGLAEGVRVRGRRSFMARSKLVQPLGTPLGWGRLYGLKKAAVGL
mmetsp:Transcript_152959/g.267296  ORF Transcript_152959/g.267296 Transcript_152959/m.267296 type:complete len:203 (-) Transcript_152959:31-639(-)